MLGQFGGRGRGGGGGSFAGYLGHMDFPTILPKPEVRSCGFCDRDPEYVQCTEADCDYISSRPYHVQRKCPEHPKRVNTMDMDKCPNCSRKGTLVEVRTGLYRMYNENTGELREEAVLDGEVEEQIEKPFPGRDANEMSQRGESYVRPVLPSTTSDTVPMQERLELLSLENLVIGNNEDESAGVTAINDSGIQSKGVSPVDDEGIDVAAFEMRLANIVAAERDDMPAIMRSQLRMTNGCGRNDSSGDTVDAGRVPVQKFGILCRACGYFLRLSSEPSAEEMSAKEGCVNPHCMGLSDQLLNVVLDF